MREKEKEKEREFEEIWMRERIRKVARKLKGSEAQSLHLMARVAQLILIGGCGMGRKRPRSARRGDGHSADARRSISGAAQTVFGHFVARLHDPVHLVLALPQDRVVLGRAGIRVLLGGFSSSGGQSSGRDGVSALLLARLLLLLLLLLLLVVMLGRG